MSPHDPNAVLVATMYRDDSMAPSFAQSMIAMVMHDAGHDGRIIAGQGPLFVPATPMSMHAVRNRIAQLFVDESPAAWLMMIDADMGFAPDTVDRLLEAADPVERPVMGALCFGLRRREPDDMGGFRVQPFPTLYDFGTDEKTGLSGFRNRYEYTENAVTRVDATGAACLLVHRSAFTRAAVCAPGAWFDRLKLAEDGELLGEDMSFCARLAAAGVPVYVHTGVKTTHLRTSWLGEEQYLDARALHMLGSLTPTEEVPA